VEYRGIRYTIKTGIVRGQWMVSVYPSDHETIQKTGSGPRAVATAQRMIDEWLEDRGVKRRDPS
jgi:hypothetical protein